MKSWCLGALACAVACGSPNSGSAPAPAGGGTSVGAAATAGASGSAVTASGGTGEPAGGGSGGDSVGGFAGSTAGAATGGAGGTAGSAVGGSAGQASGGASGSSGAGGSTSASTPTFVAVGYKGLRVRSTDLGVTWIDSQTLGADGDNEFLLRAVSFGKGVFVALGWKVLSSPDGKTWTEGTNPQHQWLGGVQFSGAGFVATGGYGYSATSADGIVWKVGGTMPNNEASRSLAFGASQFVTATDPGNWYKSSDGASWTLLSGGHAGNQVAFCNGTFGELAACTGAFNARGRASAQGVTVRTNNGKLERSTDGAVFTPVANSPTELEDVAVGYLAPQKTLGRNSSRGSVGPVRFGPAERSEFNTSRGVWTRLGTRSEPTGSA